jgi:tRNA (guanine37-N1)-methyltransferase
MRVDVVSIFPDYLSPLGLSLPGKAQQTGLLDLHVHDLRIWTHDRHRTVDDTPYGGGAGMVMKPEPWGEALDDLLGPDTVVVVPTPSGLPFTQRVARELSAKPHLVFACGRYEGIDQRVVDEAASRVEVRELSIGDYVLNGGEVAALAMIEAIVRLLPGFMGNAESLAEESHADGLLEYPVYTKPASWRGRDVPEVLLGGDHAAVSRWRTAAARERTAQRRPDLLPAHQVGDVVIERAVPGDAAELFVLQRACWVAEQADNPEAFIPALAESPQRLAEWLDRDHVWVARSGGRLVGAVRARLVEPPDESPDGQAWFIGRLMVAPDRTGRGLGRRLLELAEAAAPPEVTAYELVTGARSRRNQKMYKKAGYRVAGAIDDGAAVRMVKRRR